jgi:hypothetical protein
MIKLTVNLGTFIDFENDTLSISAHVQKLQRAESLTAMIKMFQCHIGVGWVGAICKSVAKHTMALDILTAGYGIKVVSDASKTLLKSLVKPEYSTIERLPEEVQVHTLIHYHACVLLAAIKDSLQVDANRTLKIILLPLFYPFALVIRRIAAYKLAELVAVEAANSMCVEIMQDYSKKILPLQAAANRFVDAASGDFVVKMMEPIVQEVDLFQATARTSVVEVLATTCVNHMKILHDLSKSSEMSDILNAANDKKPITDAAAKKIFGKFKNSNIKLFNKQFKLFKDLFLPAMPEFYTDLYISADTVADAAIIKAWAEFKSSWCDSWGEAKKTMVVLAVMQAITKPCGDGFSKKDLLDAAKNVVADLGETITDTLNAHIDNCKCT